VKPFQRLVREVLDEGKLPNNSHHSLSNEVTRFTADALNTIQEVAESFVVRLMSGMFNPLFKTTILLTFNLIEGVVFMTHRKGVTLSDKDMKLATRMYVAGGPQMMGAIYHKNHGGGNNMEPNIGLE
jgi:histone H3/H4